MSALRTFALGALAGAVSQRLAQTLAPLLAEPVDSIGSKDVGDTVGVHRDLPDLLDLISETRQSVVGLRLLVDDLSDQGGQFADRMHGLNERIDQHLEIGARHDARVLAVLSAKPAKRRDHRGQSPASGASVPKVHNGPQSSVAPTTPLVPAASACCPNSGTPGAYGAAERPHSAAPGGRSR